MRSPSKSLEWIWDSTKFSAGITKTLYLAPDIPITLHPHAFRVAQKAQITDLDQHAEFQNFLTCCDSKMFLFDIGAHYGLFSLAAARRHARAVAVDPSPEAVQMISRHARLNHCDQMIYVVHAAVSASNGSLQMLSSGVFSDGYFKFAAKRSERELTKVPAITIDDLTRRFGAPTHIKIDVEGHEAAVIAGAKETLKNHAPQLFVELHNELIVTDGGDPHAALSELYDAGYNTFSLAGIPIDRTAIVQQPIIRVVAKAEALAKN